MVCRKVAGGSPTLSPATPELREGALASGGGVAHYSAGAGETLTLDPHEFLQTHLSLEPPEQPLTSDVKVDSLRPKLKWKVLSPSPLLSSPLPPLLQRLEHPELDVSQQ